MLRQNLTAAVLVTALVAPAASGRGPQIRTSAPSMVLASSLVLGAQEVGSQWSRLESTAASDAISCPRLQPDQSRLVETGLAAATFTNYRWGYVWDTVRVFQSSGQAARFASAGATHALVLCERQTMTAPAQRVRAIRRLLVPAPGVRSTAFRVVASMIRAPSIGHRPSLVIPIFTDTVILRFGRADEEVVFGSLSSPLAQAFEERIVRVLALRLRVGAGSAAGHAA